MIRKKKGNNQSLFIVEISNESHIQASNSGTINIDATIVEQDIQYPTDLGILKESREHAEEIIDIIC